MYASLRKNSHHELQCKHMKYFLNTFTRYFLLVLILLHACEFSPANKQAVVLSGLTMGTTYTVKIFNPDTKPDGNTIATEINRILNKINSRMSTYIETSRLSMLNKSRAIDWQEIPLELYTVIEESLRINTLSYRAFDITIGPVVNLWGFGPKSQPAIIPDPSTIQDALEKVGSQYIHLRKEPYAIKKDIPDLYIDLSAIAKGYAVDVIAEYLNELGINNYMVEIGGEIKTRGTNPDNKIWQIGIEKPLDDQRSVQTVITLKDTGMATSGDYRNYFEENNIRYSHTIDPSTGKPITHKLASVTVLHPSTMTADAMATALLVLGPEQGFQLALKENIAALFVVHEKGNFIEKMTPRFKPALATLK